jgi:hypothetical protein
VIARTTIADQEDKPSKPTTTTRRQLPDDNYPTTTTAETNDNYPSQAMTITSAITNDHSPPRCIDDQPATQIHDRRPGWGDVIVV